LLARMAEAVYWTGRYLERAEGTARLVQVHTETHIDLPVGRDVGWEPLLSVAGDSGRFSARHPSPGGAANGRIGEEEVVDFLLSDRDNPSSVLSAVTAARANLRTARPVVPREAWEAGNNLWLDLCDHIAEASSREGRVVWLRRVLVGCQQFGGIVDGTMNRDQTMSFLKLGQNIERADLTTRVIATRSGDLHPSHGDDPYDIVHWMAVLRSLAAYQPFRRAMPARPPGGSTLLFLLQNQRFPRAVHTCLTEVAAALKDLPRSDGPFELCTAATMTLASAAPLRLAGDGPTRLVEVLQRALADLHRSIEDTYFLSVDDRWETERSAAGAIDRMARTTVRPDGHSTQDNGSVSIDEREWGGARLRDPGVTAKNGPDEALRFRIVHRTTYRYNASVSNSRNHAHLRPRDTVHQQCCWRDLTVEPAPASWSQRLDVFDNLVDSFSVEGPFEELVVTAASTVVVTEPGTPTTDVTWEAARDRLAGETGPDPEILAARPFCLDSPLVAATDEVRAYAGPSFPRGRALVDAVLDLTGRIHHDFTYDPGFTTVSTPLDEVLCFRRGVCQDFAHLAVGCVRAMGLAARYVSGYLETVPPPGQERMIGSDASHAWLSVLVPDWGWLDLDPTNDAVVRNAHVTTAWGRDYADVAPLTGIIVGTQVSDTLEVAVDMTREEPPS
jgi:uncharacterized alpha-E superfamily protein/transglutaminase-like putative cysteine protease